MDKNIVGSNIKYLRKQKNISQCDLATKVGLKRSNIASYENGAAEPKLENLKKIANFFDVNVGKLICNTLSRSNSNSSFTIHYNKFESKLPEEVLASDDKLMKHFIDQSKQFENVINSLNCLHCYKMDTVDLSELPNNVRMLIINSEELMKLADNILESHQELINVMRKKLHH